MSDHSSLTTPLLDKVIQHSEEGIIYAVAVRTSQGLIKDFRCVFFNEVVQDILNKTDEALSESTVRSLFSSQKSYSNLMVGYRKVVKNDENAENSVHFDDGQTLKRIRIRAVKYEDGILMYIDDVTLVWEMLAANFRSQNSYYLLMSHLPGIELALVDKELTLDILQGSPFKLFQGDIPLAETQNMTEMLGEKMEPLLPLFELAFQNEKQQKEISDGEDLYRMSFIPFLGNKSPIAYVLVLLEDISSIKISQSELRNKIYALESANESLEQFAYVASHDLQEPLRKIRAFGDRLSSKYASALEGSGQDYIERMQNAAARMQTLIDDLLRYSRVGRVAEELQPVDLEEMVYHILSDMETTIEDTQAVIHIKSLPVVQGEASQFRQLFQNLISNAIKFRMEGKHPEIYITAEEVQADAPGRALEDVEGWAESASYYKLTIKDNGIGFDEKYLDRIFNIFQRLHGRSEYQGTGIGLAICRKIVENHGGYITAASKPGEGATFIIVLPVFKN